MNNVLDPKALDANRAGRLTLLQALGLIPWVLFGAFLFLTGIGLFIGFLYNILTKPIDATIIFGVIFNLGGGGVMTWFGYLLGGTLLFDIMIGRVRQAEGPGTKYSGAGGGRNSGRVYYYSVGSLKFQIPSHKTYKALRDANLVHAYYLPRSKTLVNVEFPNSRSPYGKSQTRHDGSNRLHQLEEAEQKAKGKI